MSLIRALANPLYRFLNSFGRFGRMAYITCMYGSAELSQAFCRLCAVYGGIYMLRVELAGFEVCKVCF